MSDNFLFTLWGIGGYLLGSIPFGLVLCYLAGYGDIRKIGSGNIGATNVLRTGNKWLALLTVILDASKAAIAAMLAYHYTSAKPFMFFDFITQFNIVTCLLAGFLAVIGHNFPIWLKFRGGKGVASAFGFILVTQPTVAGLAALTWLIMAFTFKYSSLAAISAALLTPLFAFFLCEPVYAICYTALALLVLIRHHANIKRLLTGQESKIKLKKESK